MAKQSTTQDTTPNTPESTVDEDWPVIPNNGVAVPAAEPREVKLIGPGGVIAPANLTDLKQMSFTDIADKFVPASEAMGEDMWGAILDTSAKDRLVGVPLALVYWEFHDGDMGEFASIYVLTQSDDHFIVNDGSTGIYAQLRRYSDRTGVNNGIVCPRGLRVSEYDKELPNGKTTRAKTYYLEVAERVS